MPAGGRRTFAALFAGYFLVGRRFAGCPFRMRRLLSYRFTWLVLLVLLLAIGAERVPASQLAVAPLLALGVPVLLLLTALLALYWLLRRQRIAIAPLLALVLAWGQVERGLPLHWAGLQARRSHYADTPLGPTYRPQPKVLRLLSDNVRIFNVYAHLRRADPEAPAKAIAWLKASPADVLCLQEYYQEPPGTKSADGTLFQVGEKLRAAGRHVFVSKSLTNSAGAEFGLAIFSRQPIVGRGEISFGRLTQNHAMWVDVVSSGARDTVRIFNAHLQSMSLDEGDIVAAGTSRAGFETKGRGLLRRFVRGAATRAWQADTLLAHIARSPHPVLLAGDLNDLPYSYAYTRLAGSLQNAWATVGFGLGNTYHGRLPPLLRIDQQFAGPQWQVLACRIHTETPYSDHFPVEAAYRLR